MKYYRLYEKLDGRKPLGYGSGEGRWNIEGIPLIYCSSIVSLCMMEHYSISGGSVISSEWELATLEIKNVFTNQFNLKDLPKDWATKRPFNESTQKIGTDWVHSNKSLGLILPSTRIPLSCYPKEHNLIINPRYSDNFEKLIKIIKTESIDFNIEV